MTVEQFKALLKPVLDAVAKHPVDTSLAADLNARVPPGGPLFRAIETACHQAIEAGWMCAEGTAGRRFGRVIEASPDTHDLSVDVVALKDIVGPHHRHPNGEVCLNMPVTPAAKFDGHPAGWCVYPPDSAHRPTVTNGEALVLYLLPGGQIEFTGQ